MTPPPNVIPQSQKISEKERIKALVELAKESRSSDYYVIEQLLHKANSRPRDTPNLRKCLIRYDVKMVNPFLNR